MCDPKQGKHGTPADMLRRDISMRCGSAVGNLLSDFACPARCPEAATPAAITSEVLGRATPVTVENPELSLGRVTVMPGAVLSVHYHPGTQIGVVVQGETYSVFTGEIEWHRGDARLASRT